MDIFISKNHLTCTYATNSSGVSALKDENPAAALCEEQYLKATFIHSTDKWHL